MAARRGPKPIEGEKVWMISLRVVAIEREETAESIEDLIRDALRADGVLCSILDVRGINAVEMKKKGAKG